MENAARTHPYTVRLAVDLDPAGNPIGWSVTQRNADSSPVAIAMGTPGPFDSVLTAFNEARWAFEGLVGEQLPLLE